MEKGCKLIPNIDESRSCVKAATVITMSCVSESAFGFGLTLYRHIEFQDTPSTRRVISGGTDTYSAACGSFGGFDIRISL